MRFPSIVNWTWIETFHFDPYTAATWLIVLFTDLWRGFIAPKRLNFSLKYRRKLYWLRSVLVTEQNDNNGLSSWSLLLEAVEAVELPPLIVYVAMQDADVLACWFDAAAFNLLLIGE